MKKFIVLTFCLIVTICLVLVSCGEESIIESQSEIESVCISSESEKENESKLSQFTGITFNDKVVDYDGKAHKIEISGAPSFATVQYSNAGPFVNAGTYTVNVTISASGYETLQLSAKLTINKIDFVGVEFNDAEFNYDGNAHEITISGSLPSTASVTYSSNVNGITNSAVEIGAYTVTATITDQNYNTLELTAELKITATEDERFMAFANNGTLYFQNALDDDEFYLYDFNSSEVKRIGGENALDVIAYSDNGVAFASKSLFMSSIKTATYDGTTLNVETVLTENARYIQIKGQLVYYCKNGLTNNSSGIYVADCSSSEPTITCLSVGKAHYLTMVGNVLYFADGTNGNKLSKINVTGANQTRSVVVDEKINNLTYFNGTLYYTVNNLLGDYIEKYTISSNARRKLTSDAGTALTVIGDKIYYVNVDKISSKFIGKGIYCVSTSPLSNNNSAGTKLIDGGEMGVCSLTTDGTDLYYYDVNGYKLMQYDISSQSKTNLLEGFVKPEDPTPISTGSKVAEYGGNIYYLDIWDGKTLRCYKPSTGENYRITNNKVVDFSIIGDVLYVNMVSFLVNNDTYKVNLKTGGQLEKINNYSSFDICSDGQYVYYIEENAAGAKTAIHQCKLDGSEDEIIYDKGVTNLRVVGNFLYFVDGSNIHAFNLKTKTDETVKVNGREIHTDCFDTDGTYLYYRDMYGLAWSSKRLARCKLDGSEDVKIVDSGVDPTEIKCVSGYVYFYTDTLTGKNGLYRVSTDVSKTTEPTAILEAKDYYAMNFAVVGNNIYFVNYKDQITGNARLYHYVIGNEDPKLIK